MLFGSRGPSEEVRPFPARSPRIRHRNVLSEKAWEIAVQGLGKCATTSSKQVVSPQILNILASFLYCQYVYIQWTMFVIFFFTITLTLFIEVHFR